MEKNKAKRRAQIIGLLLLMLGASISEIISIGLVIPFLAVILAPQKMVENSFVRNLINVLDLPNSDKVLGVLTASFCVAILLSAVVRLSLIWVQTKLSYSIGSEIAIDVFRRTLYQPYSLHITRNSGDMINDVYAKAAGVSTYVILPAVTIASALILLVVLATLIVLDPTTVVFALLSFGVAYGLVIKLTHKRLLENSRLVSRQAGKLIKVLQEAFGGIRDVIIDQVRAILL